MSRYHYKFNSEHFRHSTRSQDNGFYTFKSKEYKIYEPKVSTNSPQESTQESFQTSSRYRDSFNDPNYYSRNGRHETHQYKRHIDQKQYRNSYSYIWAKGVNKDKNILLKEATDEEFLNKKHQNPKLEIERGNGSTSTIESDSNDTSPQKSELISAGDTRKNSCEPVSVLSSAEKVMESVQGGIYDIQAFWEQIKKSNTDNISSPVPDLPLTEDTEAIEKQKENIYLENKDQIANLEPISLDKEELKKGVPFSDLKETNIKNNKERENEDEESEETEESDEDRYSNIDIMVEKRLLNNEYDANCDENVFDDFNEETRKEDNEDLNNDERPIWENLEINNQVSGENYKADNSQIPDSLRKCKSLDLPKPPDENIDKEKLSQNFMNERADNKISNNILPLNLCNEQFLKSILKIGSDSLASNNFTQFQDIIPRTAGNTEAVRDQTRQQLNGKTIYNLIPWTTAANRETNPRQNQHMSVIPGNQNWKTIQSKDHADFNEAGERLDTNAKESSNKRLPVFRIFSKSELTSAYHKKWECKIIDCTLCVNITYFSNNSDVNNIISTIENPLQNYKNLDQSFQNPLLFTMGPAKAKRIAFNLFEGVTWKTLLEPEDDTNKKIPIDDLSW